MKSPVLIIAFNRPDLTEILIQRILEAGSRKIYFSVDGPRKTKSGESELVEKVRSLSKLIPDSIELFCNFSEDNNGCRVGVTKGIDWFFQNEEMGIILEDDCFPSLSFFDFCDELLERYKLNDRVGMISGCNLFFGRYSIPHSYFFSSYFHIWGWATWRRAWSGYRSNGILETEIKETLQTKFPNRSDFDYWLDAITDACSGNLDTWDHQWSYHNWKNRRVSIMPKVNLVKNLGFRLDATHTTDPTNIYTRMENVEISFPLQHPIELKTNSFLDEFSRRLFVRYNLVNKILYRLRIFFNNLIRLSWTGIINSIKQL